MKKIYVVKPFAFWPDFHIKMEGFGIFAHYILFGKVIYKKRWPRWFDTYAEADTVAQLLNQDFKKYKQ